MAVCANVELAAALMKHSGQVVYEGAAFYSSKLCDPAETTKTGCFSYKAAQLAAVSLAKIKKTCCACTAYIYLLKVMGSMYAG
jgi:hypothetical protein